MVREMTGDLEHIGKILPRVMDEISGKPSAGEIAQSLTTTDPASVLRFIAKSVVRRIRKPRMREIPRGDCRIKF
jgi:hypothetical protein